MTMQFVNGKIFTSRLQAHEVIARREALARFAAEEISAARRAAEAD